MSSAFRSPAFQRLWVAGLVSDTGDWFLFIALPLVVLRLSGSAVGTSIAFILELAPAIVLAPLAAQLAGRFDRRWVMVGTNIGQALALIPLLFVHSAADLPIAYAVIAVHASLAALFEPAKNSLLPDLVDKDKLVSANALVGLNQNLGRLVGGPLGGIALMAGGLPLVIAIDAASYVVSAILISTLPRTAGHPHGGAHGGEKSMGVGAALRIRPLRPIYLIMGLASIAQGMFLVLFLLFVTDPLHGSDGDVGLLRGIQAIGAIAAGLTLGFFTRGAGPRALTVGSVFAFGIISLVTWNLPFLTTNIWPYVVLFAIVGAPGVVMMTGVMSVMQTATAPRERGAAFAAVGLIAAIGQAGGILLAGLAGNPTLLSPLLDLQAALYLAAGVVGLVWMRQPATTPAMDAVTADPSAPPVAVPPAHGRDPERPSAD
ncbi:MFS transporter [Microbacterium sp. ASV49]|uniref:MFS transporter n=1 Tax=Microbacterium candidum TaxID=3041922 RepID=A0ABT7N1L3_9MICO|nr:MFS transporter [Microbacterium sp. ASV49]MDL9980601.1 MFS transporter [Microbacterium sp. ASV49]